MDKQLQYEKKGVKRAPGVVIQRSFREWWELVHNEDGSL